MKATNLTNLTNLTNHLRSLLSELRRAASPRRAAASKWFFKTGPGEYGEGDRFLGISVPELRKIARRHQDAGLGDTQTLLRSPWHEARLLALLILVRQYERGDDRKRAAIHRLYLRNKRFVNNWDLVDSSAAQIVGAHLVGDRRLLRKLAISSSLWDRRIAMVATYHYIRQGSFDDAFAIARLLRDDRHDLIHKAVGWMLREIGKRDVRAEMGYLDKHAARMPRTMLRYAIERLPKADRLRYLSKKL